jgi:hypothetical protein
MPTIRDRCSSDSERFSGGSIEQNHARGNFLKDNRKKDTVSAVRRWQAAKIIESPTSLTSASDGKRSIRGMISMSRKVQLLSWVSASVS